MSFPVTALNRVATPIRRIRRAGKFAILTLTANQHCSPWEAIKGYLNYRKQWVRPDELRSSCRIRTADSNGFELWGSPIGDFWCPKGGACLPNVVSEIEREIYGTVLRGEIALDCGANVGAITRTLLNAGARLVVAVEPQPHNVECLRRNFVKEIEDGHVIVYAKGVWGTEGSLSFTFNQSTDTSFVLERQIAGDDALPVTTIDKIVEELRLERVDYIKMDIEGAERNALAGAGETLKRFRPRLAIATYHRSDDPERIPAIVHAARSDYRTSCRSCFLREGKIVPEIMHFL